MSKYHTAGGQTYNLRSSISSTATTILLTSFLEPVTNTPYTMALLNTDIVYATIAPKTSSSEFISFTGITQNSDGTATLTGVTRGLAKKYPFTSDSSYKLPHAGQSQFILSDAPQVFEKYVSLENDNSITGINTFTQSPVVPTPTGLTDAANKDYVLSVVNGGPVSINEIVIAGTAGETFSAGQPVYLKASDSRWYKALANDSIFNSVQNIQLGIALSAGTAGASIASGVATQGLVSSLSLTANNLYYISDTGTLSTSAGTYSLPVGWAISTTQLIFNPKNINVPTVNEKAAMGTITVAPSASNKFLTQNELQKIEKFVGRIFTVTIASPAVFTMTGHNLSVGQPVVFSTTGALPTGLTAGTTYYVIAAGLTSNNFEVSSTLNGSAVNTSGTQSGIHSISYIWTKALGAKTVQVIAIGGGGGGGRTNANVSHYAGGGGGGGLSSKIMDASLLSSTETIVVGGGGLGATANNTSGASGTASTFGVYVSGSGGAGGGPTTGSGGTGGLGMGAGSAVNTAASLGGAGGDSSSSGSGGTAGGAGSAFGAGGGGGAGDASGSGGAGGAVNTRATPIAGGTGGLGGSVGTAGGNATDLTVNEFYPGAGGGAGGGSSGGGVGGVGGNGGRWGGGGGGGGDGITSANGGNGADGIVVVITTF